MATSCSLASFAIDLTGSYAVAWQSLAGAIALGCVGLMLFLKETRRSG